ncbi:hypothetical protein PACTADRAFT_48722 [Pachysolen tannophilus NRRL Y-2460]|uniref:AB hydrolase-1 domain-containing protein n=1 Tax=Pachysolen tannophilus NRRL Y-2460 TaxID=669874 RepID=A0A1E4TYU5_PACTA|nr:hypothetical protein PACTADRAFT_48722 [Pachysolen tannophilus NRRL Y-2460]
MAVSFSFSNTRMALLTSSVSLVPIARRWASSSSTRQEDIVKSVVAGASRDRGNEFNRNESTNTTNNIITSKSKSSSLVTSTTKTTSTSTSITTHTTTTTKTTATHHSYRRSTAPSGVPLTKILSNSFPLSLKESFKDYLDRKNLEEFQKNLLSSLSFYPQADQYRYSKILKIKIDNNGNYLNEFCIYPRGKSEKDFKNIKHLILIHGYGAGLGFFINNLTEISKYGSLNDWCIHAIDLLGYGTSSRPKFPHHLQYSELETAESWFTKSLKAWFEKRGLDNLNSNQILVCSHSLGAYISCVTNMEYPQLFKKLILVSPAGISKPASPPVIPQWFHYLWNKNVSPFALVRYTGALGSLFVSGWTSRRFGKLKNAKQRELLHKYSYGIFNAPGSGEYFLNYVLAPGGVPRKPLIDKIHKIQCNLTWCYGEDDWMDLVGGKRASDIVNERTNFKSEYHIIPDSGHHVYLDNIKAFNSLVIEEMKYFEKDFVPNLIKSREKEKEKEKLEAANRIAEKAKNNNDTLIREQKNAYA